MSSLGLLQRCKKRWTEEGVYTNFKSLTPSEKRQIALFRKNLLHPLDRKKLEAGDKDNISDDFEKEVLYTLYLQQEVIENPSYTFENLKEAFIQAALQLGLRISVGNTRQVADIDGNIIFKTEFYNKNPYTLDFNTHFLDIEQEILREEYKKKTGQDADPSERKFKSFMHQYLMVWEKINTALETDNKVPVHPIDTLESFARIVAEETIGAKKFNASQIFKNCKEKINQERKKNGNEPLFKTSENCQKQLSNGVQLFRASEKMTPFPPRVSQKRIATYFGAKE